MTSSPPLAFERDLGPSHRARQAKARVRSRSADVAATVTPLADGRARVQFAQKLRAVAPGQAVVFYDRDLCLGGGWIVRG